MKGYGKILENVCLFLFLLLIPTQLGKHFWPDWSYVQGIRIDYLSPTLYLVDIVWGLWIGTHIFNNFKIKSIKGKSGINFQNILTSLFVIVNVLIANNKWVAVCRWLRIGQLIISYKVLKSESYKVRNYLFRIIPCWIVVESLLGVAQLVKGGSLQGIWYWLGERRFEVSTIGVASMSVLGEAWVRAYGTFSHPNSMAGFLLVSLLWWGKYKNNVGRVWMWWMVMWLGVAGVIISGSRLAWLILVVVLVKILKERKLIGGLIVIVGIGLILVGLIDSNYQIRDFVGGWDSDGIAKRVSLNFAAMRMWKENFLLGVGNGNFLVRLPDYQIDRRFFWWQPVHNIYLLVASEIGILGIMAIGWWVSTSKRWKKWSKISLIWGVILITGLWDHYWVTLPQNIWLLMLVLSLI